MLLQHLVIFLLLKGICSYYIYNAQTNQVISHPSLNNLPDGFKIIRAPKTLIKQHRRPDTRGKYCPKGAFICDKPYDISSTYQFECEYDSQCPKNYFCCPQKCFKHKICSKGTSPTTVIRKQSTSPAPESGECEKWPYSCPYPYPYSFSYKFKCDSDKQCPKNHLCCRQNCFTHKICSKKVMKEDVGEFRIAQKSTTVTENSVEETTEAKSEEEFGNEEEDKEKTESASSTPSTTDITTETTTVLTETTTVLTSEQQATETASYRSNNEEITSTEETTSTTASSTLDPNAIYPEYYYDEKNKTDNDDE